MFYVIVFLLPLIPAIIAGYLIGRNRHEDGYYQSAWRLMLSAPGGVMTYVITASAACAILYRLGPAVETYELELALRGTSAAIEAFLKDGGKLHVAVKAKDNPGQEL